MTKKSRQNIFSKITSLTLVVLSAICSLDTKAFASSQNIGAFSLAQKRSCIDNGQMVEPSKKQRSVKLSQFGLVIQIPENYRTLLHNNGDVWILNPADYEQIVCTTRGGQGGRGLYASAIRSIPNPKNLPLNALIPTSNRLNYSTQPYSFAGLKGVLRETKGRGGSASFFVKVPGIQNIIEITEVCDCSITAKDLIPFLKSVSLLR